MLATLQSQNSRQDNIRRSSCAQFLEAWNRYRPNERENRCAASVLDFGAHLVVSAVMRSSKSVEELLRPLMLPRTPKPIHTITSWIHVVCTLGNRKIPGQTLNFKPPSSFSAYQALNASFASLWAQSGCSAKCSKQRQNGSECILKCALYGYPIECCFVLNGKVTLFQVPTGFSDGGTTPPHSLTHVSRLARGTRPIKSEKHKPAITCTGKKDGLEVGRGRRFPPQSGPLPRSPHPGSCTIMQNWP
jgi:hypothetical protein